MKKLVVTVLAALTILNISLFAQTKTIYVDQLAFGANNGTSWGDACKTSTNAIKRFSAYPTNNLVLIKGGIYLYPTSTKSPQGKLRLLYECNPIAFIVEQAGGKASDGFSRIMEIVPTALHERCPFFCGSANMVDKVEEFMLDAKMSKY